MGVMTAIRPGGTLAGLLRDYSTEVTPRDLRSIEAAADLLPRGAEVFIAAVPGETPDRMVEAAVRLRRSGLTPVPHVAARNLASLDAADRFIGRLRDEAGVDRALALGGDRDTPAGALHSSQQLVESGVFRTRGFAKLFIACYPEAHPSIPGEVLEQARRAKLRTAADQGLDVTLVSQFCFEAAPIIALAKRLGAPYRVGVAGPAGRATLIRYGLMCGIGPSLKALRRRQALSRTLVGRETPEDLLAEIAAALQANPALGACGVHIFSFGGLGRSVEWAESLRRRT